MNLAQQWQTATVAEPISFDASNLNSSVGVMCLHANQLTILSLDPAADFELNTDIVTSWKLVFQDTDNKIIGDGDYQRALAELAPYTLDSKNGSILVQPLSQEQLQDLVAKLVFA